MADEPIDLKARREARGNDDYDYGPLLFTVYHYERGHFVHIPEEQLPADRKLVWKTMLKTAWHEADSVFEATEDPEDEIIFLGAIATDGRMLAYMDDDRVNTLDRVFWLQRRLVDMASFDGQTLPSFKCVFDNDNQSKETTNET